MNVKNEELRCLRATLEHKLLKLKEARGQDKVELAAECRYLEDMIKSMVKL